MLSQANRGEDIEFYADRYEERQEVLRKYHREGGANLSKDSGGGGFPEEDARESRKTAIQQSRIY